MLLSRNGGAAYGGDAVAAAEAKRAYFKEPTNSPDEASFKPTNTKSIASSDRRGQKLLSLVKEHVRGPGGAGVDV